MKIRSLNKYAVVLFALIVMLFGCSTSAHAAPSLFDIEAVDTMKLSRDGANNSWVTDKIPMIVEKVAQLHPTHIAVATPYDEEFYSVLQIWVQEARKHHLKVWFRGNMSAWEGWFDHKKYEDPNQHHDDIHRFITNHPELFQEGDIFTPAPEPENGGFGDPRQSEENKKNFFDFLPRSYRNCVDAFRKINTSVSCGYFSTNGDVAKMIPTYVYQQSGGVQVIDHYVRTPEELIRDIKNLYQQNRLPIVLGEFGLPIPDIHGDLSDGEQDRQIRKNFEALAQQRDIVKGINYWTAFGGSTKIFDDSFKPKQATATITEYFSPTHITGRVLDEWDDPIPDVAVEIEGLSKTTSTSLGEYSILAIKSHRRLFAKKAGYFTTRTRTPFHENGGEESYTIHMVKTDRSIWERVTIFLHRFGLYRRPASS